MCPFVFEEIKASLSLTAKAVISMTTVVERIHARINYQVYSRLGLNKLAKKKEQTQGVSRFVYNSIRALSKHSEVALGMVLRSLIEQSPEAMGALINPNTKSVLNGICGDYLHQTKNALAISMQLRKDGQEMTQQAWISLLKKSQGKILLLVHGLCMNDQQWHVEGYDHGEYLAETIGCEVVYLQYNSGLHISENGQILASLLEKFFCWQQEHFDTNRLGISSLQLSILAHSMGGLVTRSACYYAQQQSLNWIKHVEKFICLGTPHHGSVWERVGHKVHQLLNTNSYSRPLGVLANMRSAGITDLRYGNLIEQDWNLEENHQDEFFVECDKRQPIPLPQGVNCYQLAAVKGNYPRSKINKWMTDEFLGDGLVSLKSALGQHKNKQYQLEYPEGNFKIISNCTHMDLLSNPNVSAVLASWLADQ
ncbi:MAG: hypothetical protein COW84_04645 [Gammaproteobacteria bacterium CG22_combo_CG10-13_8_21_14_all_40_8]|nr:MAG: hypothetical protein COW84_04645 [Gammaproteobacteria bacterium CG22_combo_CG10-13_8_21_14_all_40_8]